MVTVFVCLIGQNTSQEWCTQFVFWCGQILPISMVLVQDCSNSSALAVELLQSCTEPSIYFIGSGKPPVPVKQPCRIWVNPSHESPKANEYNHSKTMHNKTLCMFQWILYYSGCFTKTIEGHNQISSIDFNHWLSKLKTFCIFHRLH